MSNLEGRSTTLKALAALAGICGALFLTSLYLIIAPLYGPESNVDLWSPVAESIENAHLQGSTMRNITSDYYYFSLGARPLDEVISKISTSEEAIKFRDMNFRYISDYSQYGEMEYVASLAEFHRNGWAGDCEDFAIAIAGLLEDDGYAPLTLSLKKEATAEEIIEYGLGEGTKFLGHRVYVYQEDGKFGSIGTAQKDDRQPVYSSVEELAKSFENEGYSANIPSLRNLNVEFAGMSWLDGQTNLK